MLIFSSVLLILKMFSKTKKIIFRISFWSYKAHKVINTNLGVFWLQQPFALVYQVLHLPGLSIPSYVKKKYHYCKYQSCSKHFFWNLWSLRPKIICILTYWWRLLFLTSPISPSPILCLMYNRSRGNSQTSSGTLYGSSAPRGPSKSLGLGCGPKNSDRKQNNSGS